ncbi:MAG: hypothetical protein AAF447_09300, partial [Myxococcota bacterium]
MRAELNNRPSPLAFLLLLAVAASPACKDDEPTAADPGETTSGGEAGGTADGLERPPGSVDPDDDGR